MAIKFQYNKTSSAIGKQLKMLNAPAYDQEQGERPAYRGEADQGRSE